MGVEWFTCKSCSAPVCDGGDYGHCGVCYDRVCTDCADEMALRCVYCPCLDCTQDPHKKTRTATKYGDEVSYRNVYTASADKNGCEGCACLNHACELVRMCNECVERWTPCVDDDDDRIRKSIMEQVGCLPLEQLAALVNTSVAEEKASINANQTVDEDFPAFMRYTRQCDNCERELTFKDNSRTCSECDDADLCAACWPSEQTEHDHATRSAKRRKVAPAAAESDAVVVQ